MVYWTDKLLSHLLQFKQLDELTQAVGLMDHAYMLCSLLIKSQVQWMGMGFAYKCYSSICIYCIFLKGDIFTPDMDMLILISGGHIGHHMEVSYCTFGFGTIIRRDLRTLSPLHDSQHDNLHAFVILVHTGKATHSPGASEIPCVFCD